MAREGRGAAAERFARRILTDMGFEILAANYHGRSGEIDIIAREGEYLCFVEVKARRVGAMVTPAQSVTVAKQRKIVRTALLYLQHNGFDLQPRFDLFCITMGEAGAVLDYDLIKGAFDADGFEGS